MYSTHNEGKSFIAERFIRSLKNKIYEYITSVSKNVYIVKLDDIVNKCNNAYYSTIKLKPVGIKLSTYIGYSKENNEKILNLKLGILLRYQNLKIFLRKITLQIGLKRFLWLKTLKILYPEQMFVKILMEKNLLELFTKKNWKKQIKKGLELKNQSREKMINYLLNGKDTKICVIAG